VQERYGKSNGPTKNERTNNKTKRGDEKEKSLVGKGAPFPPYTGKAQQRTTGRRNTHEVS